MAVSVTARWPARCRAVASSAVVGRRSPSSTASDRGVVSFGYSDDRRSPSASRAVAICNVVGPSTGEGPSETPVYDAPATLRENRPVAWRR
jgi:hypothetical protein